MPTISSGVSSSVASSVLARSYEEQADSIARISSGSRIIRAADDAASLAVGTALKADASVLKQATINLNNTQSVLSVADGGLSAVGDLLERQAVLAAQASSGTITDTERAQIDTEFQAINAEIDALQGSLNFNGANLLDGSFNQDVLVGTDSSTIINVDLSTIDISTANLGTAGSSVDTAGNADAALTAVNNAIDSLAGFRASVGSLQSQFSFRENVVETQRVETENAISNLLDVDIAEETVRLNQSIAQTEAAIFGQVQGNAFTQSLLSLIR